MISLTKIPIKILNNTKNFLILPNKTKTFIMNINLNTMPHEAYMLLWHSDKNFVGTKNYVGLAYYWNYDYRHYLRDASPYVKRKIHSEFIKHGLDLVGSTEKHLSIIRKYTKLN